MEVILKLNKVTVAFVAVTLICLWLDRLLGLGSPDVLVANAALGAAAGGLFGGLFDLMATSEANESNEYINEHNLAWEREKFAQEMAETQRQRAENREWSLSDRDYENWYNSPAQQAARYRAAGLNPYLMMAGQQSIGSAGAAKPNVSVPRHGSLSPIAMQAPRVGNILAQSFSDAFNGFIALREQNRADKIAETQIAAAKQKMYLDTKESIEKWIDRQHGYQKIKSERDLAEMETQLKRQLYLYNNKANGLSLRALDLGNQQTQAMIGNINADIARKAVQNTVDWYNAQTSRHLSAAQVRSLNAAAQMAEAEYAEWSSDLARGARSSGYRLSDEQAQAKFKEAVLERIKNDRTYSLVIQNPRHFQKIEYMLDWFWEHVLPVSQLFPLAKP